MRLRRPHFPAAFSLLALTVVFAACAEGGRSPAGPELPPPAQPRTQVLVECRASVKGPGMSCGAPRGRAGAASGVLLGQQNVDVRLSSNDVAVTADTFAFDVNIQNVLPQPSSGLPQRLGVDSLGVDHPIQIFFLQGPLAPGGGSVEVANADGVGTFTGGNQPYFEYPVVLDSGEVSPDHRWKLRFSPGVDSITFLLMVSAVVPRPAGWVDVSPDSALLAVGSTTTLAGTPRNFAGQVVPGDPISWASSDPTVASVDPGTGVVTARFPGTAVITASASAPGRYGTAVVTVANSP